MPWWRPRAFHGMSTFFILFSHLSLRHLMVFSVVVQHVDHCIQLESNLQWLLLWNIELLQSKNHQEGASHQIYIYVRIRGIWNQMILESFYPYCHHMHQDSFVLQQQRRMSRFYQNLGWQLGKWTGKWVGCQGRPIRFWVSVLKRARNSTIKKRISYQAVRKCSSKNREIGKFIVGKFQMKLENWIGPFQLVGLFSIKLSNFLIFSTTLSILWWSRLKI